MSGFDTSWLALREPADRAARNDGLVSQAADYLARRKTAVVMDIGCGTGSTYRSLSPRFPGRTRWQLVDYDAKLLDEARRLIGSSEIAYQCRDLSDPSALVLDDVALVTASAFFDLCSASFCEDLCERLNARECALYAALNYDGRIVWEDGHALDAAVIQAFNRHQRTDKGFGAALGPQATGHLVGAFSALGYRTQVAPSSWNLGAGEMDLQEAFVRGMVEPVMETSSLSKPEIDGWLAFRLAKLGDGGRLKVGHSDLLAIPA